MMVAPIPLERWARVAPLGLRFWDVATGSHVSGGLRVQAVPKLTTGIFRGQPAEAFANRSGIYAFSHLAGLSEAEFGTGSNEYWAAPPTQREFIVTVQDTQGRFLPVKLTVKAPTRGLLAFSCPGGQPSPALPAQPAGVIPLFSTPGRAIPGGMAVLRAVIQRNSKSVPWAMVEAYSASALLARGVSDDQGQVVLFFPYPKIILNNPMDNRPPLTTQTWPVDIKVFSALSPPGPGIPDFCSVVSQPGAIPLGQTPDVPLPTQTLRYGQELILKTQNQSELFLK
jgi:hypothetical protein